MQTDLFYYVHYKPFIFKNIKIAQKAKPKMLVVGNMSAVEINSEYEGPDFSIFMNNTINDEVIKYAKSISDGFNMLKNSAFEAANRIVIMDYDYEGKIAALNDSFIKFSNSFNFYKKFASDNAENSSNLLEFSEEITQDAYKNEEILSYYGLKLNFDEEMIYNSEVLIGMNERDFNKRKYELLSFLKDFYDKACDSMDMPMSSYMSFKNLDFYYNYVFAPKSPDKYRIIEMGMLVDINL